MDINELITYSVTDAAISEMREMYLPLRVLDASDSEGYAQCKDARNAVRAVRLSVEERRKELKKESLEFGRLVDAKAKAITEKVEAVEAHLCAQLKIVDDEKKRREEEAARKAQERINHRQEAFAKVGALLSHAEALTLSEEEYQNRLARAEVDYDNELERRRLEKERLEQLEKERIETAAKIAAAEEEARKLRSELEDKKREEDARLREQNANEEARIRVEHELARKLKFERLQSEMAAAAEIADKKTFERIKVEFPTLESAWVEISRLWKIIPNGENVLLQSGKNPPRLAKA